jgi:hypothetical protein
MRTKKSAYACLPRAARLITLPAESSAGLEEHVKQIDRCRNRQPCIHAGWRVIPAASKKTFKLFSLFFKNTLKFPIGTPLI